MNISYISGFFDADGSISIARNSGPYKTLKIDFTNVELSILEDIKKYLLEVHKIKGYISKKPGKKDNHKTSYSLSYSYRAAEKLCQILKSNHPKKVHRLDVYKKYYQSVTNRNGKYTDEEVQRKLAFERLFNWSTL